MRRRPNFKIYLLLGTIMADNAISKKRTKIVATIGPASWDEDKIRRMIAAGMNVARINFSHGNHEQHERSIDTIRRIAEQENAVIAILCDLQGPKIRIGTIKNPIDLADGEKITLTLDKADGTNNTITAPHPEFFKEIRPKTHILLDDGNLELKVIEKTPRALICTVVQGGILNSNKGLMAVNVDISLPAITAKDHTDIEFALSQKTDYLALSFVRSADDVCELRQIMDNLQGNAAIVAKIERHEALADIRNIIAASDAIMVARGDLGLDTPPEEVPFHQKRIIQLCNDAGKPVITATQMLDSMVASPRPTRAEASDVYNAIIDGTDAVMLSNESAIGDFPVESVQTMTNIALSAEQHIQYYNIDKRKTTTHEDSEPIADAISKATYHIAETLNPRVIVTASLTGYTTRQVSRERPHVPILCITSNKTTYRRMALVWGVLPLIIPDFDTFNEMVEIITAITIEELIVDYGDTIIIVAGVPFHIGGKTNLLKIHKIEKKIL
jgi:pyruvate kinase